MYYVNRIIIAGLRLMLCLGIPVITNSLTCQSRIYSAFCCLQYVAVFIGHHRGRKENETRGNIINQVIFSTDGYVSLSIYY